MTMRRLVKRLAAVLLVSAVAGKVFAGGGVDGPVFVSGACGEAAQ
jgi:hypothetical protein